MESIANDYLKTLDSIRGHRERMAELIKKRRRIEESLYDYMSKKGLEKYKIGEKNITIASITPLELKKEQRVAKQELKKHRIAKMLEEKGIEEAESLLEEVLGELKKRS